MGVAVLSKKPHFILKLLLTIHKVNVRSAVNIAYEIHGKSPSQSAEIPIIVLHGLLGSKKNWKSVSKKISSLVNTSVVTADLRNHGESPHATPHSYPELASDVSHLITKVAGGHAAVLGHSMGGRTAMVLALTEPTRVAKLVVVDISPLPTDTLTLNEFFPKLIRTMKLVNFTGINSISTARNKAKEEIIASGLISAKQIKAMDFILMNIETRNGTVGWICNVDVLEEYLPLIASFPKEMDGKQYLGPTLFIGGEESDYLPKSHFEGIKQYFPRADLKYIPDVGHNLHAENPKLFVDLVTQYLSQK